MVNQWKQRMKWLCAICFMCVVFTSSIKASASTGTKLELNTYYSVSEINNFAQFDITVPENGRVRFWIENCTVNLLEFAYGYGFSSGSYENRTIRYWNQQVEVMDGGWVTVTPGEYHYYMNFSARPNVEAKIRVEYQRTGSYLGEIETNDTLDEATLINTDGIYYGNYSKEGDVDTYKFIVSRSGKLQIFLKDAYDNTLNRQYVLYEEDDNGNVYKIATVEDDKHFRVPEGKYYIEINPRANQEEYELQIVLTAESEDGFENEKNNIKNNANNKKCNQWYIGNLNSASDIDYYSFFVPTGSKLAIELKVPRQIRHGVYKATLFDSNLNELVTTCNTSNPYIKSEEEIVEAPGTYYIRVECEDSYYYLNDDYSVSLYQEPYIYVSDITISGSAKMQEGNTQVLSAKVLPVNATNREVEWSSEDSYIASVSSSGMVTAKNPGIVSIIAKSKDGSGIEEIFYIEVTEKKVSSIKISGKTTLNKAEGYYLNATVTPFDAPNQTIKWSSSNSNIVSVDSEGYVYAKAVGTAIITAKAQDGSNVTSSVTITVKEVISDRNPKKTIVTENGIKTVKGVTGTNYTISIAKTKVTGTGKAVKPKVTVKYKGKKLSAKYYTVKYSANKYSGIATVTVTGKGSYKSKIFSNKLQFVITPKKMKTPSTKIGKGAVKVNWKTEKSVSGYVVQISTSKKFDKDLQEVVMKANQKSKSFSGLQRKKTYYVRTRAYKKIQGKTVYGSWSSIKKAKTK